MFNVFQAITNNATLISDLIFADDVKKVKFDKLHQPQRIKFSRNSKTSKITIKLSTLNTYTRLQLAYNFSL